MNLLLIFFGFNQENLVLVNSLALKNAIIHGSFQSSSYFLLLLNFCWFCEVLLTEMKSLFASPSVHQKNPPHFSAQHFT